MKNNLFTTALCVALSLTAFCQKKGPDLIDSLQKAVARHGEDTNKVIALAYLGAAWSLIDLTKAFPPTMEALQLSEKLHFIKGIANTENDIGLWMSDTGNTVGAREH